MRELKVVEVSEEIPTPNFKVGDRFSTAAGEWRVCLVPNVPVYDADRCRVAFFARALDKDGNESGAVMEFLDLELGGCEPIS